MSNVITVNVANGSTHTIWCRISGDKALRVQGAIGGGVDVQGVGINVHHSEKIQHKAGATRGYTQIQRGNMFDMDVRTSSKSAYMSIISVSVGLICKNHEICKNRNYIITKHDALLNAKSKEIWKDKTGRNHMVVYNDADARTGDSDTNFSPSNEFSPDS